MFTIENEMVVIPGVVVGINKAKRMKGPGGEEFGGEVMSDFVVRASMIHSAFYDGNHIVWNIQGVPTPIHQLGTDENLKRFEEAKLFLRNACSNVANHGEPHLGQGCFSAKNADSVNSGACVACDGATDSIAGVDQVISPDACCVSGDS